MTSLTKRSDAEEHFVEQRLSFEKHTKYGRDLRKTEEEKSVRRIGLNVAKN